MNRIAIPKNCPTPKSFQFKGAVRQKFTNKEFIFKPSALPRKHNLVKCSSNYYPLILKMENECEKEEKEMQLTYCVFVMLDNLKYSVKEVRQKYMV